MCAVAALGILQGNYVEDSYVKNSMMMTAGGYFLRGVGSYMEKDLLRDFSESSLSHRVGYCFFSIFPLASNVIAQICFLMHCEMAIKVLTKVPLDGPEYVILPFLGEISFALIGIEIIHALFKHSQIIKGSGYIARAYSIITLPREHFGNISQCISCAVHIVAVYRGIVSPWILINYVFAYVCSKELSRGRLHPLPYPLH